MWVKMSDIFHWLNEDHNVKKDEKLEFYCFKDICGNNVLIEPIKDFSDSIESEK